MTRSDDIIAFLEAAGWQDAVRRPLAGDASARTYERLTLGTQKVVLMNAPFDPPAPPNPPYIATSPGPFLDISRLLSNYGYSAPNILGADEDKGLILLEDLGDGLFARVLENDPSLDHSLYRAAVDMLASLHSHTAPTTIPPYNLETLLIEAQLLIDWYLPMFGDPIPAAQKAEFNDICTAIFTPVNTQDVLVLRDFHAENLLWLPDRIGHARVGLLDYQDALAGHPAYDLVSLLEDARRDTSDALQAEMLSHYISKTGTEDATFRADYARLGAQRNMKILGIFARLSKRDGKPQYLSLLPRVWGHIQRDLAHPALHDLKVWFDTNVPAPTIVDTQ